MVQYCCVDHQRTDWTKFYNDDETLEQFPLMSSKQHRQQPRALAHECGICGVSDRKKDMTKTECCNFTEHEYQVMSYSRAHCPRSHRRYTMCGYHGVEDWCDKTKD
ncbi:hypothetical protein GGF31_004474 [Allomyces arbusculus]|nr:hypothetical protein GGF31_004474 [Allomyces arbusculus]